MLTDLLEKYASSSPESPCIVTADVSLDYATTLRLSRAFASELARLDIDAGDHVAIIGRNCAGYLIAWFGCMLRGAVAVTINDRLSGDALRYIVDQSDARAIVTEPDWASDGLAQLSEDQMILPRLILPSDDALESRFGDLPQTPTHHGEEQELCTIVYTSGTTGRPKGAMCSHGVYLATGRETEERLGLTSDDRILVYLPLCHANPQMYAVAGALSAGASLAIESGFSATGFLERAKSLGATGMTFIGTTLALLVQKYPDGMHDHHVRFCIGGDIRLETVHRVKELFGITVHEVYGSTEMGGFVSCNSKDRMRPGSGGPMRSDMTLRIVDTDDNVLDAGEIGIISMRPERPNIMFSGYYNKPDETLRSIKNFWYYPGDLGMIDSDGFVYFKGRTDDRIRRGGEMISPLQVEECIAQIPGVVECAVVGVPDLVMGEEVKAVIVTERPIQPEDVAEAVLSRGAKFMVPRYVEFVDRLPRTETGKVQRRLLREAQGEVQDSRAPRQTPRGVEV